jgi:transcriptional regulator with XRE-family HTH domain
MARKFQELVDKMPADARERASAKTKRLIEDYALDELREARSMTQARLAEILGKDQSVISRLERRTDMYVSTLADFVRAMGGDLEIRAVFPEGAVRIRKFGEIAEHHGPGREPAREPQR